MIDIGFIKELELYIESVGFSKECKIEKYEIEEECAFEEIQADIDFIQQSYHARKYAEAKTVVSSPIKDYIERNKKPVFTELLFKYIDGKNLKDSDVYNRAGIDRRHFSKIRSERNYHPGKNTVVSLCLALELDIGETAELMHSAGYSLSNSETSDLIIIYCIEHNVYDIMDVNEALEYFGVKCL